ncbi:hypothetical protein BDR22DRAFT_869910 [Usnea florida]
MRVPTTQESLTSTSPAQSASPATLAQHQETAPPRANTTSTEASPIPGQPTEEMFKAFFSPRSNLPHAGRPEQPPADITSTEASPIPGQPTEEMFKAFFSPRSNQPYTGRNEQHPEHEGSQSKKSNHASMCIQASNNRLFYTNAEICQNRPEHSVTQASYNDNDVAGGSLKIGGMTHQDRRQSVKDKK